MVESNRASVSLNAMPPGVLADSSTHGSQEDIQISLAPYIQHYLSQTGRRRSCCSVMLPVPFERAAPKSWLDPKFDSQVLEGQYQASVFPQLRLRFRFALLYILLCSAVWMIYFLCHNNWSAGPAVANTTATASLANGSLVLLSTSVYSLHHIQHGSPSPSIGPEQYWFGLSIGFGLVILLCCVALWATYSVEFYRRHTHLFNSTIAIALTVASLFLLVLTRNSFSPLGHFSINIAIILLIYTLIPLPVWQCSTITIIYSIAFELSSYYFYYPRYYYSYFVHEYMNEDDVQRLNAKVFLNYKIILLRILLQLCVHLIGIHVLIMNCVRMRGTFMKVGQNLLVRRQLEMEKQLKEKMIHSVMPPKVAAMLMKDVSNPQDNDSESNSRTSNPDTLRDFHLAYNNHAHKKPRPSNDVKSLFRPFHMHSMDNVSILFADIVGFTKMSSKKTADQLVEILNDLFERFDELCLMNGCEKISTLGDCYYCVSGCPEPRPDHAICCVEMGLGMIQAMRVFDARKQEEVKMRVGVHTGTVLCGIVGTRRVKFDVWSNDVTLANRMESTGVPELVHISEETCSFLGDGYILSEGEEVFGHRTYFVHGKKADATSMSGSRNDLSCMDVPKSPLSKQHANGMQLSKSVTNLSTIHPAVPPASPVGATCSSLNPSPVLSHRQMRIPSVGAIPKLLLPAASDENGRLMNHHSTAFQMPKITVNERLLSDGGLSDNEDLAISVPDAALMMRPNGSSGSHKASQEGANGGGEPPFKTSSKYSIKFKSWKVPKFLFRRQRTSSDPSSNETSVNLFGGSSNAKKDCDKKFISKSAGRSRIGSSCDLNRPLGSSGGGSSTGGGGGGGGAGVQDGDQICAYQQIPVVVLIESDDKTTGNGHTAVGGGAGDYLLRTSPKSPNDSNVGNTSQASSLFDDVIDIRSYISQSRSDISPFGRSGSYRSQQGVNSTSAAANSHHLYPRMASIGGGSMGGEGRGGGGTRSPVAHMDNIIVPMGRPRSSTLIPTNHSNSLLPTASSHHNVQRHSCCASPYGGPPITGLDGMYISPSAPQSRKDSGIRSNSRRSSYQPPPVCGLKPGMGSSMGALNLGGFSGPGGGPGGGGKHQRASDYFTNSSLSVNAALERDRERRYSKANNPHPDPLAACLQQLRKQSDLQLIRCVKDNAKSQRSYLVKPPLNNWTLFFKSRQMEREFRSKAHRFGSDDTSHQNANSFLHISTDLNALGVEGPPTLATPRYNTYIDIIVGVIVFVTVSLALFLLTPSVFNFNYRIWVCLFAMFSLIQVFAVVICTKQMCRKRPRSGSSMSPTARRRYSLERSCLDSFFDAISCWYPWHFCGGVLLSLPVISILVNFALLDVRKLFTFEYYYGFLLFLCVIHFCNFTQLNCWMRNALAFGAALGFIIIILCQFHNATRDPTGSAMSLLNASTSAVGGGSGGGGGGDHQLNLNHPLMSSGTGRVDVPPAPYHVSELRTRPAVLMHLNESKTMAMHPAVMTSNPAYKQAPPAPPQRSHEEELQLSRKRVLNDIKWLKKYQVEIYIDLVLVLLLVWFLNREYEIGYRLAFYGSAVANQDKIRVQHMKNQADMLLHNIIPKHVAEQLKNTAKYSENHRAIGIIFASIVNFNEMYDESYLGGKEYLRVLNELMGDFDELLTRKEFKCVEKIKTIGSTFMAASGLDPCHHDTENHHHLVALMDFAIAMQTVVTEFNKDLLEFNLILRIGFNVGDVTAGVIGTSKLYYDIWGDAVNVASRMDSTGVPGRVQVGAACLPFLDKHFEFEGRGSVYVKGKDNMDVFLLKAKKIVSEDAVVDNEEFHNLV